MKWRARQILKAARARRAQRVMMARIEEVGGRFLNRGDVYFVEQDAMQVR